MRKSEGASMRGGFREYQDENMGIGLLKCFKRMHLFPDIVRKLWYIPRMIRGRIRFSCEFIFGSGYDRLDIRQRLYSS